jgi:hypothetical protein
MPSFQKNKRVVREEEFENLEMWKCENVLPGINPTAKK